MKFDICLIGSGISCTQTLLQILNRLEITKEPTRELQIAVIEKNGEFWKGIPYGSRSSVNSLTITTLGEFIHPNEKESFLLWLKRESSSWINQLKSAGGETAEQWISHNLPSLHQDKWEEVYIPRFLYGLYLNEKVTSAIADAQKKGTATISLIQGEAIDASINGGGDYAITIEHSKLPNSHIHAAKIVLCIGSGTIKPVPPPKTDKAESSGLTYINDTYFPALEDNLKLIQDGLHKINNPGDRNLLILGSNASSLELLYLIKTKEEFKNLLHHVVVLSYSGMLPHRITEDSVPNYEFENLEILKKRTGYNAHTLISTIEKDLEIAFSKGVHIGDMYYQLSELVVDLLKRLDFEQEKYFYEHYGNRFTKLIRRAGAEYRDAAQELLDTGKLILIKGAFQELLESGNNGSGVLLSYQNKTQDKPSIYPEKFPLVVNCGGFEDLEESSSRLIHNLVSKNICRVNNTKRGFEVSEEFEANKNLYVMGPLLGGIFNKKIKYWHVENAKRVHALSSMLSEVIVDSLKCP